MTEPEQPVPDTEITHLETIEVRDLVVIGVPPIWWHLDNDDQIKEVLARQATVMMLTTKEQREMSGRVRPTSYTMGPLREFRIDLIRKPEDADGIVVEHPNCKECVVALTNVRKLIEDGESPTPIWGVVQFTFDQVVGAITTAPA